MTPARRDCERLALDLAALSAGELEPAPRAAVEAHLAGCPVCAALLAELRAQREELLRLEEPEGFEEALSAVHRRALDGTAPAPPVPLRRWSRLSSAAAAAVLALLAGVLWWYVAGPAPPASHPAPPPEIAAAPRALPAPPAAAAASIPEAPRTSPAVQRSSPVRPSAPPYDPVRVARRILESDARGAHCPVLVQESPEAVVYWLATPTGGV